MTKKTIEERYKQLSPKEHVLMKHGMYIGNINTEETTMFVCDSVSDKKFKNKTVNYNAGFCKLYDEVLTNASDHYIRTNKVKYIKITVNSDSVIIENDGPGIPIVKHKEQKKYVPEMIFGNLMTGENFSDTDERMVGGTHGLGIKLTNIFSTKFIIETADGKNNYTQIFSDNMNKKSVPIIKKSNKNYTKITYFPDFERFGLKEIDKDTESIFLKRANDIAAYSPNVNVYYNGELISFKTYKDYMDMFLVDYSDIFYERISDNWEIGVALSQNDMFQHTSMVNGISTYLGGSHVNFIANQLSKQIFDKLKNKNIKSNMIKNHLFLFVNCKIPNPLFDTQTKESLKSKMTTAITKDVEISANLIKKILTSDIKTNILNYASFKELQDAKKTTKRKSNTVRIDKLDDANFAGKPGKTTRCHLFITEGDSAASTAKRGLSVIGSDYYGIFPLKGKPMNVKKATLKKMLANAEISSIIEALGLEFGVKYNSTRHLRYGKLVIMADADCIDENALILTKKGYIKIKYVTYEDEVFTHTNEWKKIINIIKTEKNKRIKITINKEDYYFGEMHEIPIIRNGEIILEIAKNIKKSDKILNKKT